MGSLEQCVWQINVPEQCYSFKLGSFPVTNCQVSGPSASKFQIHLKVLKRCFSHIGSVHSELFTPPIVVNHPSDNIIVVQHLTGQQVSSQLPIQSKLNVTLLVYKLNSFLVINHSNLVCQQVKT